MAKGHSFAAWCVCAWRVSKLMNTPYHSRDIAVQGNDICCESHVPLAHRLNDLAACLNI